MRHFLRIVLGLRTESIHSKSSGNRIEIGGVEHPQWVQDTTLVSTVKLKGVPVKFLALPSYRNRVLFSTGVRVAFGKALPPSDPYICCRGKDAA